MEPLLLGFTAAASVARFIAAEGERSNFETRLAAFVEDELLSTVRPEVASPIKNGDKKEEEEGSAYDEFVPAAAVASQYYMDQIHLEKPTKSEIQDALKKQDDGDEPLRPPGPCPSEYQLEALNQQLKALPMVIAFNEMEKKKATN
ncbi:unnamed protein product [Nippostrongylus brasiliensis]|uniref:Uncharacterized protein n=1 Tax=Nippostrongylus brasiliensis TaxID=27835 RepID=A0A0N4YLI4_NIPBR|nr:unnamed protein product [Nippostrongylus brasiliensis]